MVFLMVKRTPCFINISGDVWGIDLRGIRAGAGYGQAGYGDKRTFGLAKIKPPSGISMSTSDHCQLPFNLHPTPSPSM